MIQSLETSIILSLVLEDEFHEKASKIWNQKNDVVCSTLTSIEATIALRRPYKSNRSKLTSNWLSKNEKRLNEVLSECSLVKIDESILSIVRIKKEISDCRSLDAIHIATAIFLKDKFNDSYLQFYSFDNRVKEVAKKLGLKPHNV